MAITQTVIDNTVSGADGLSAVDITGNGLVDILLTAEDGRVYWYEQTTRGNFTKRTIKAGSVAGAKIEGALWIDIDGDGYYEAVALDQVNDRITLYRPDVAGVYTGTWSGGHIITDRKNLQDAQAWDIDGDGVDELVFSFEGQADGEGGINWLDYDTGAVNSAASYNEYVIIQHNGAWWMGDHRIDVSGSGSATSIAYTGRDNRNPSPLEGVFYVTPGGDVTTTWTRTQIDSTAGDWLHIDVGNFFGGDYSNDIVAQERLSGILAVFDSNNSYAKTLITNDTSFREQVGYNVKTVPYFRNGRNKIVTSGYTPSSTNDPVSITEWYWTGSAWAVREETYSLIEKIDDRWFFADMNGTEPLELVAADSRTNELSYFAFTDDSSTFTEPVFVSTAPPLGVTGVGLTGITSIRY